MNKPHKCLACDVDMICEGRLCFVCQRKHPDVVEKAIKQLQREERASRKRLQQQIIKKAKELLERKILNAQSAQILKLT